jgi:hypothetical protein
VPPNLLVLGATRCATPSPNACLGVLPEIAISLSDELADEVERLRTHPGLQVPGWSL